MMGARYQLLLLGGFWLLALEDFARWPAWLESCMGMGGPFALLVVSLSSPLKIMIGKHMVKMLLGD